MNKKFHELEEIDIRLIINPNNNSNIIYFSLPIKNSCHNFYKKFIYNDINKPLSFLDNYIHYLTI